MVSDHRGYFADFSIKGIFDRQLPKLISNMMRGIKGNNPVNITKYIIFLFNYIEDHKLLKKARELSHKVYFDAEKANILDQIITEGMLAAEKECKQNYRLPWDETTHDVMTTGNILRALLSHFQTNTDNKEVIAEKLKTLITPFDLPTNYEETTKQLKETRKEARQLARDKRSYNTTIQQEREQAFIRVHVETMR